MYENFPDFITIVVIGLFSGVVFNTIIFGFSLWACIWAWLDDAEKVGTNKALDWLWGFFYVKREDTKHKNSYWKYYKPEYKDEFDPHRHRGAGVNGKNTEGVFFIFLALSATVPVVIWLILKFYVVSIPIGICYLIAVEARATRRLQKRFKQHVDDKDAHK